MADTKISALASGNGVQDTDAFVIARSDSNFKVTGLDIKNANVDLTTRAITIGPNTSVSDDTGFASGDQIAIGASARVFQGEGIAIGRDAIAAVSGSANTEGGVAVGVRAKAPGKHATAIGHETAALGLNSVAVGDGCSAEGFKAISFGNASQSFGDYSWALGDQAGALSDHSFALGAFSGVGTSSDGSIVIGSSAQIPSGVTNAVAIGRDASTSVSNTATFGSRTFLLASYSTAGLPDAGSLAGGIVYDTTSNLPKFSDGGNWNTFDSGGGISELSEDSTPQLGGPLDLGPYAVITTSTDRDITITPNGNGSVILDGISYPQADGSAGQTLTTDGAGNIGFATRLKSDPTGVSGAVAITNIIALTSAQYAAITPTSGVSYQITDAD